MFVLMFLMMILTRWNMKNSDKKSLDSIQKSKTTLTIVENPDTCKLYMIYIILSCISNETNNKFSILLLASFVYCGSEEPLWICAHEFTTNHECVYAICSSCKYRSEDNDKAKRRK